MAKYVVNVIIRTYMEVEVEAHNEEEAENLALEKVDPFEADDWDYDIDCVYRDGDDDDDDEEEENEE